MYSATDTILCTEAHQRHLRVILDFIPNHASDLHPWFLAARSSIVKKR